ncbi:MAG: bifunctional DNA primase/polymerase [Oligoflexales bacterium]
MTNLVSRPELIAFSYIERGWSVIPIYECKGGKCSCGNSSCNSPGKHPRTKNGLKDASTEPLEIFQWWKKWPNANIGILTGKKSNLVVVDIDPRHGGDKSWNEFSTRFKLKNTLSVETGDNGLHLYYQYPNQNIKNKVNLLPGVDIRSEGGYVVAPPSVHASNATYKWMNKEPILNLPKELENLILGKNQENKNCQRSQIREGERNSTLFLWLVF